jgi:exodeoxyribonuclease V alpha subunit
MIEGTPGTPFEDEVLIRRLRWASDETGFAIIEADRDGDEIVLVGTLSHLEERERVRVVGQWQDDRRYGLQVKVSAAEPLAPTGDAALLVYLKRVKHVGSGRAEKLLARYGDDVLEAVDRDPAAAFRALGLFRNSFL